MPKKSSSSAKKKAAKKTEPDSSQKPDKVVTVRLTEEQWSAVTRLAIRRSTQPSTLIREMVNEACYQQDPGFRDYLDRMIEAEIARRQDQRG